MKQIILFIFLIGLVLSSCGTNKEGQLKPASKIYQNTTARYNGFFNGKELFNKSIKTLDDSYRDNYNLILPLYRHVAIENAASVSGDLDNAMQKATTVVNLHPKSYWVDDCYFLLGRSQFLKKEYAAAQHTFEYMSEEFHPDNLKESVIKYGDKYGAKKAKRQREATPKVVKRKSNRKRSDKKKIEEEAQASSEADEREQRRKERERNKDLAEKNEKKEKSSKAKSRKERLKERSRKKKESEKAQKKNKKDGSGEYADSDHSKEAEQRADKIKTQEKRSNEDYQEIEEDEDHPSYFLKHRPVYAESMLWLAKTYAADKRYADALFKLTQLENDPFVTDDLLNQIHEVRAYTYLEKGDHAEAVVSLELASEHASKNEKARMYFIMGQIYQSQDKAAQAAEAFNKVVKLHPGYEMEFNARINSIRAEWGNGPEAQEKTIKLLKRMLKDEKNEEFQDQIHFALGELYLERGLAEEAKINFRLAAQKGAGNPLLQTEAYLILAQSTYESGDYIESAALYDTTMIFMDKGDTRYADSGRIRDNVRDVADQLLEIQLQDSLMMIAAMTDEERREFAYNLRQSEIENERELALRNATSSGPKASTSNFGGGRNVNFFAYNDKALKKGKKEFNKKWRNRNNEDDWRRSNKLDSGIDEIDVADVDDIRADEMTIEEINEILADVPTNKAEINQSDEKRMRAMYLVAGYYDTRLGLVDKSIEAYKQLLLEYPSSSFSEEAYYALYQAYKRKGNTVGAEQMKNKLSIYNADSKYLKIINDPDFLNQAAANEETVAKAYEKAYDLFENGRLGEAKQEVDGIIQKSSVPKTIKPRLALLSALCIGGLQGKELYMAALDGVIKDYPSTPESTRAKEIVRHIRGDSDVFNEVKEEAKFQAQKNRLHYLLIVFKNIDPDIKINKLRALVSDYNLEYHKLEKLRVGNVFLSKDDTNPILIVRKFTDAEASMNYYNSIQKNKDNFLSQFESEIMVINQRNYREVLRSKSLEDYIEFFKENYL